MDGVVYHEVGSAGPDTVPVQVDLTVERIVCSRHGEPFRTDWPDGFTPFSIALFEDLVETDTFADSVGNTTSGFEHALDATPICERISKPKLLRAYVDSGVGVEGTCGNCERDTLGTPYTFRTSQGRTHMGHLCFECLVYQLRWLN